MGRIGSAQALRRRALTLLELLAPQPKQKRALRTRLLAQQLHSLWCSNGCLLTSFGGDVMVFVWAVPSHGICGGELVL
ncbi:unnamed protein product [Boreogadus saida]